MSILNTKGRSIRAIIENYAEIKEDKVNKKGLAISQTFFMFYGRNLKII